MGIIELVFDTYIRKPIQVIADIPKTVVNLLAMQAVQEAKREIAINCIDENVFQDAELKEKIVALKAAWQHSPETQSDIGRDLMSLVSGRIALLQLESISGTTVTADSPVTSRMFDQIAIVTDLIALSGTLEIIGGLIPTTNAQYMGIAIREYLEGSGLTQITGFGYGMLFSNVISPMVSQELNEKVRPTLPDINNVITGSWRGNYSAEQKALILSKYGLSDEFQAAMEQTMMFYPTPQDFITFAVRDAYNDEVVSKYGYDSDYPARINDDVIKAGMSADWMKYYWRSHWELPSVTQGFEMLHRSIIDVEDMRSMLRINDMAPYWIDKIIGMSYTPYTRVDTRRLFIDGIITRDEVKRNYLDSGYDEDHAEKMTAWTCKSVTAEKKAAVKDVSESKIIQSYTYGEKSADETAELLKSLGYDDDEAALLIAIADQSETFNELDQEWKILKASYLAGIVDDTTAASRMDELKLPQRQQEKWLRQLKREATLVEIAAIAKENKAAAKKAEE